MATLAGRSSVVVIIDESLHPLEKMKVGSVEEENDVISHLCNLMSEELIFVFTNLRMDPFKKKTGSERNIQSFPLLRLGIEETVSLIKNMVELRCRNQSKVSQPMNCLQKYKTSSKFKESILMYMALWIGGRPRLCDYVSNVIVTCNSEKMAALKDEVYDKFVKKYHVKTVPRQSVVLALLGVGVPPDVICTFETYNVDTLISLGVLSREMDGRLYQPPVLLKHYCKNVESDPALRISPEDVSLSKEVAALLDCLFPNTQGTNFEQFDRLQFRLTRLLRSQLLADVSS
jgi:hypothetical protein